MLPESVQNSLSPLNMGLSGLKPTDGFGAGASTGSVNSNVYAAFGDILNQHLQDVNNAQVSAEQSMKSYALGDPIDLHQVMTQVEKAEIAMEFTAQLRNKFIATYQEVMRMNV